MKIYSKVILIVLPLIIATGWGAFAINNSLSSRALENQTGILLDAEIESALNIAARYTDLLARYGLGSVGVNVRQAQFDAASELSSITIGEGGFIFIVNEDGEIVSHPDKQLIGTNVESDGWFQYMKSVDEGGRTITLNDVNYLSRFAHFRDWSWYLVAVQPETEVLGPIEQSKKFGLIMMFSVTLASAILLALLTRWLMLPLNLVTQGAKQIGMGNFDTEIPVRSKDEIGELAQVFNQTRDKLRESLNAVLESEERFRLAVIESPIPMLIHDEDDNNLTISNGWTKYSGYTLEDIPTLGDWTHHAYGEESTQAKEIIDKLFDLNETEDNGEWTIRTKTGEQRIWHFFTTPIGRISNGKRTLLSQAVDITERKKAENELQIAKADYQDIFDNAPVGVFRSHPKGYFLSLNFAAAKMYGYDSPQDMMDKVTNIAEQIYYDPSTRKKFQALIAEQGEVMDFESQNVRTDGTTIWTSTNARVVRDDKGETLYYEGFIRNITHRKQAEIELIESETRFRNIIDVSPVPYALNDEKQNITYLNPAFIRTFGYDREDIQTLEDWWPKAYPDPEYRKWVAETWQDRLEKAKQTGSLFEPVELNIHCKDGTIKTALVEASSLEGVFEGIHLVTLFDITDRKKAEENLQRQVQRLNALHMIDLFISSSFDLRMTIDTLLNQVINQLGVDAADVYLYDQSAQILENVSSQGFINPMRESYLRLSDGLAGGLIGEHRMIQIPDLTTTDIRTTRKSILAAESFVAYIGVPLIVKGKVEGVLEIFHRSRLEPDPDFLSFLDLLSGQAAIAIDNGRLFQNLQRTNTELSFAYDATIEGWSRAMDMRDQETPGHAQRVMEMTLKLAQELRVPDSELVHMRRGALLHDIGKLGIPDKILFKTTKLNENEWKVIRNHPELAHDMLSSIQYLKSALDIPYCHHEHWDGNGFPRGLKGEEIPLAARIFTVADAWDVLTSPRPYRKAWTKKRVLDHIRKQSGRQFDPQVVEAFLNMTAAET